jgi:hypothetical protein
VLDALDSVAIEFSIPSDWARFDGRICVKASLGWNECVRLKDGPLANTDNVTDSIPSTAFAVPGEPLELWLQDRGGDQLGIIGVIPWDVLSLAIEADRTVIVSDSTDGNTAGSDLREAASSNSAVLRSSVEGESTNDR